MRLMDRAKEHVSTKESCIFVPPPFVQPEPTAQFLHLLFVAQSVTHSLDVSFANAANTLLVPLLPGFDSNQYVRERRP